MALPNPQSQTITLPGAFQQAPSLTVNFPDASLIYGFTLFNPTNTPFQVALDGSPIIITVPAFSLFSLPTNGNKSMTLTPQLPANPNGDAFLTIFPTTVIANTTSLGTGPNLSPGIQYLDLVAISGIAPGPFSTGILDMRSFNHGLVRVVCSAARTIKFIAHFDPNGLDIKSNVINQALVANVNTLFYLSPSGQTGPGTLPGFFEVTVATLAGDSLDVEFAIR